MLFDLEDPRLSLCLCKQFMRLPTKKPLDMGILILFHVFEILDLLTFLHRVLPNSLCGYHYGCFPLRWSRILQVLHQHAIHLHKINPMFNIFLVHPLSILPLLLPRMVKVLVLVTDKLRRSRKGRIRRIKIIKGKSF